MLCTKVAMCYKSLCAHEALKDQNHAVSLQLYGNHRYEEQTFDGIYRLFVCRSELDSDFQTGIRNGPLGSRTQSVETCPVSELLPRLSLVGVESEFGIKLSLRSHVFTKQLKTSLCSVVRSRAWYPFKVQWIGYPMTFESLRRSMTKLHIMESARISNAIFSNGNILRKPPFLVDGLIYCSIVARLVVAI